MPARQLDHFTIRAADLECTRDFYASVLGLTVGPRPDFKFAGYWLYCSDKPVVHLVAKDGAIGVMDDGEATGRLDHIAFRSEDFEATVKALDAQGVAFRQNEVPDFHLRQLFLRDRDGIMIELNFYG